MKKGQETGIHWIGGQYGPRKNTNFTFSVTLTLCGSENGRLRSCPAEKDCGLPCSAKKNYGLPCSAEKN